VRQILEATDDHVAGIMQLSRDILYKKIPAIMRDKLVNQALKIGRQTARDIAIEYGTQDPILIAKKLGIKIEEVSSKSFIGNILLRAEYVTSPPTIRLYKNSIFWLIGTITRLKLEDIFPPEKIMAIHVAHEIFHHIENVKIGLVSKCYTVNILKIGPIRIKSEIKSLSEIAANAFADTLLNLKVPCGMLDYIIIEEIKNAVKNSHELE
jgi:hypothetical protein